MSAPPEPLRLWTFQYSRVVDALARGRWVAPWEATPENWRPAYRWMATELDRSLVARGLPRSSGAPIWCWHSCSTGEDAETVVGTPPTGTTAFWLFGSRDACRGLVRLELDVPPDLALLSSYSRFNDVLVEPVPTDAAALAARRTMFDAPWLDHPHDDIQAVLPWIEPAWLRATEPVVVPDSLGD